MVLKILLTVGYWLYALIVFVSSFFFVRNAPIGCTEGRKMLSIAFNIVVVCLGFILTVMIWSI